MRASPTTKVQVTEIFYSIQGESSHAGKPCVFVRLTGCSLRCGYCDTRYSYAGGQEMTIDEILAAVETYKTKLVEVTGGEPLEQTVAVPLMRKLLEAGYTAMLETGGHVSLRDVPSPVIKIVDVKCPDSNEGGTFLIDNLEHAAPHDEFKFVISSRTDYEWSRDFYHQHLRERDNTTLFSPAHAVLPPVDLSNWILSDGLGVRLQLQIHKYIWGPSVRGV